MLTHYWLFFSLQTPVWKPDLQYPRGSFLWPLQPEDSVSNSPPRAQPPLPQHPRARHWPCDGTCSPPEQDAKARGAVVPVVKPTLAKMPLGERGAASPPGTTTHALHSFLASAMSRPPPEQSPPRHVKTWHGTICRGSHFG